MQNIGNSNYLNPVGSEEIITGSSHGLTNTKNKLDMAGGKGFSEANASSNRWDNVEDSDATAQRILKTFAVTQYRREE